MENLWSEFRCAPSTYFQAQRTSAEALVASMTKVLASEQEKKDQPKLTILGIWQEMCHVLFNDAERLRSTLGFLKDLLIQQKSTCTPLVQGQVLCTITTLLIEMELILPSHDQELADFIRILFEYIERMKSESNRLIKSIACDCLRELEMSYPGLLSSKIGHFYGMSVAENSYIHQNYMALLATALDHAVQRFLFEETLESISSPPPMDILTDLLSYGESLKTFKVSKRYKEIATAILEKKVPRSSDTEVARFNEVKKGMSFILDWSHLFTPSCLVSISQRLISCVQFTSFSPKILKRLLQFAPSQDIRLFQLMLLVKLKFGSEICDKTDYEKMRKTLLIICGQTSLPEHHRVLAWEWLLRDSLRVPVEGEEVEVDSESPMDQSSQSYEMELRQRVLLPSMFDSLELFFCKCKALCIVEKPGVLALQSFGPKSVSDMVVNLLKLVRCGTMGRPVVTLYRILYYLYTSNHQQNSPRNKEIERLVIDLVLNHPKLIPNTIDFISSVQSTNSESPLPLNVMSEMAQFLVPGPLQQLLPHLPLYLVFIKHALAHPLINPVVMLQLLARVLTGSSLCAQGPWDMGNTLIEICTTAMRVHPTETIFRDLSDLLQMISKDYNDLDIQDRARFYHQLMLTVSGDKLSAILTLASDSNSGSSLSDIVEARISNSMFPSAPPIRNIPEGSSFISLERVVSESATAWGGYRRASSPEKIPGGRESVLNAYLSSLDNSLSPDGQNAIQLQYKISFVKKPQGISNMIYAFIITLSSNKHYHKSPEVYVPFLSFDGNGSHTSSASKLITLTFYPKDPVPAKFELSAVFSTEEGLTYSTMLSPVTVSFTDFFLPLPNRLQEKASADVLFSILWNYIESIQQSNSFMAGSGHGVLSTVHLESKANDWKSVSPKELRLFEVHANTMGAEEGEELEPHEESHRIVIFLPPCYHLLLKFSLQAAGSVNVAVATDNWRLLPLVNTFLQTSTLK